jgi:hypothetical protein
MDSVRPKIPTAIDLNASPCNLICPTTIEEQIYGNTILVNKSCPSPRYVLGELVQLPSNAGSPRCPDLLPNQCPAATRSWQRSSEQQYRETHLAPDRPRDATEHALAQVGVAIGTRDDEIGAESGSPRQ